ncbi:MAG TPA: hypothetical protein PK655_04005 [archaeon]|uniref:hypothetical protein n=1 Tax=Methanoculleus sp. TaxID=90427 RepID=UPI0025FECFA5|nr:hypothetical protein [Methanoculleus sp.]MCK9319988.1 hypothetical protein [Methanoculleus sp.]HPV66581.1 hypothetical protein [archaeon]
MGGNNSGDEGQTNVFKLIEEKVKNTDYDVIYPQDFRGSKESNLFDVKINNKNKAYLFEVWSPEENDRELVNKFKINGSVAIDNDYLVFITIKKYIIQFKGNPNKILIINLDKDGFLFSDVNHNYYFGNKVLNPSIIKEYFSVNFEGIVYGLFHQTKFAFSKKGVDVKDIPKFNYEISINHMPEMWGVITFLHNEFVELILNPWANVSDTDILELQRLLCINKVSKELKIVSVRNTMVHCFEDKIYDEVVNNKKLKKVITKF